MRTPTVLRAATVLAAALLTISLAGCAGASSSMSAPQAGGTQVAGAPAPANGSVEKAAPDAAPAAGTASGTLDATNVQVARTASMTLAVTDPLAAAKQVQLAAIGVGGVLTSEDVATEKKDGIYLKSSSVTVSVPSDRLTEAMDAIAKAGTVNYQAVRAEDVTSQVVDLEARIKVQRDSVDRIAALMAKTGSIAEMAKVEGEYTARQTALEQMLAQQKSLANRVAMAPIAVTLTPPSVEPPKPVEPNAFLDGLKDGWEALGKSAQVILTIVGALLPFALVAAAIGVPWVMWRRRHPRAPRPVVATAPVFVQGPPQQQVYQQMPAPTAPAPVVGAQAAASEPRAEPQPAASKEGAEAD